MTTLPLQNMKIRIKDAEHSKQVQECLFKLGFRWNHQTVASLYNADDDNIYAYDHGRIFCSTQSGQSYFDKHENKEVTLEDLQAMLAEPDEIPEGSSTATVETASVSVPTFSVDDTINTYMSQIQKRLADTNLAVYIYADEIRVANTDNDDEASVKSWEGVLEIVKVKQAYLSVFKGD